MTFRDHESTDLAGAGHYERERGGWDDRPSRAEADLDEHDWTPQPLPADHGVFWARVQALVDVYPEGTR